MRVTETRIRTPSLCCPRSLIDAHDVLADTAVPEDPYIAPDELTFSIAELTGATAHEQVDAIEDSR